MGDEFEADISDLKEGSSAIVIASCDYCGKQYEIMWYTYNATRKKSFVQKDCCRDCQQIKARETIFEKYGGYKEIHDAFDEQRSKTNIERYGSKNVFGSKEIIERIKKTNIDKYGAPYPQGSQDVREKTKRTCMERYGVEYYIDLFKGAFIKENSPVWKGGVENSRVERATYEYNQWRRSVFEKDLYTCVKCGAKSAPGNSVELNAHHILNWNDNEEYRYDVDNGITLCQCCHNEFHRIYGKRNNNRQQLDEFLLDIDEKVC